MTDTTQTKVENKAETSKISDKKFSETLEKLTQALDLKLKTNYLDQLQVNQILTNFRETQNYSDIKQYLE
jgi:hypothetical protein